MTGGEKDSIWPMPKFYFRVTWDESEMHFQEVSGLDADSRIAEYRAGQSPLFSGAKMPGMMKCENVTMKKGVFAGDGKVWDWFAEIKMNVIKRKPVTIELLDESGAATMVWKLQNAFPVKVTATDMKAEGGELAVEAIELAHEGLTIENG